MSADSKSKHILEKFWVKKDLNSSRIIWKGLHYTMEGYIQNVKIHTEDNKLKFSWYSGLPHSLVHITHYFLSHCGLDVSTPFCSFSVHVTCSPSTSFDHVYYFLHINNINPPLNCSIMPPPCCFQLSCLSRCPSIFAAGMSLAHLRSKGGA